MTAHHTFLKKMHEQNLLLISNNDRMPLQTIEGAFSYPKSSVIELRTPIVVY